MIILCRYNSQWWRKNEGWRFKLDDDENIFFEKSIVVFSIDPTWLIFIIGTQHHGLES